MQKIKGQTGKLLLILVVLAGCLTGFFAVKMGEYAFEENMGNWLYSKNATVIITDNQTSVEPIVNLIDQKTVLFYEMTYLEKGIYTKNANFKLPIIEGRFFQLDDYTCQEKKAVVGKNYLPDLVQEGSKRYLNYRGGQFEVLGILGTDGVSTLDNMLLVNLNGIKDEINPNGIWVFDHGKPTKGLEALDHQLIVRERVGISRLMHMGMFKGVSAFLFLTVMISLLITASLWLVESKPYIRLCKIYGLSSGFILKILLVQDLWRYLLAYLGATVLMALISVESYFDFKVLGGYFLGIFACFCLILVGILYWLIQKQKVVKS